MNNILKWISENPGAFASLISAIIAASAAVTVFAVTQFLTYKRERTQFLTPKLEELYLLLNEMSENNVDFFKLICRCVEGNVLAKKEMDSMDELDLCGFRKAKKIIMYIRLYFPQCPECIKCYLPRNRSLMN